MKKKPLDYDLLLVILVSSAIFLSFFGNNMGLWWDETVYLSLAKNLHAGEGYFIADGGESFRPPLLPVIFAGLWMIFGVSEATVMWIPPFFAVMSVIVTYLLAKKMFGKRVAIFASLMLATSSQFLFYSERFLTEPLFVFLGTASVLVFLHGTENEQRFCFPLTGLLISLAFLTRYAGFLLFSLYFLYPAYLLYRKRKKHNLFMRWDYWLGVVIFAVMLIPWILNSMAYYGSPFGSILTAGGTVDETWFNHPPYFYFLSWVNIFGYIGMFALPGFYALIKRRKQYDVSLVIVILSALAFFMFIVARKEERYLIHYFSFFYILAALGIEWLRNAFRWKNWKYVTYLIVSVLLIANAAAGFQLMISTGNSGISIRQAGEYIKARISEGETIVCNNAPPLHYYTDAKVLVFPQEENELFSYVYRNNVAFLVIDIYEPTYPDWVWKSGEKEPSKAFDTFNLEGEFQENGRTILWVYSV